MSAKIVALVLQTYVISKASFPPNQNLSFKKVLSTEGLQGFIIGNFVPMLTIALITLQALMYIYIMDQQETGLIPIFSNRFSSWNLSEVVLFLCGIGGASLRLWCFRCLDKFFTFNVMVKKDHQLITTGPYSFLVHPAYTGGTLMLMNVIYIWYKLYSYAQSFPGEFGSFGSSIQSFSLWNIVIQVVFLSLVFKRVLYEEKLLKQRFHKKWDIYFNQRKRFIPFIF